ncbi:dihydroneopterin triphosphate 2'-epimerase [Pseudoalteromonas sp. MMG012]|uniref:dihydroneopterin triphosphate 2'-epimerase n=1 Tax=Pseudoalteromonas sp. MMG012 TaxID=2822686 RepID=UPI001B3A455F|nr:dihydroneopterin triphosphate 2'-epimerase [Pseudoalteromonas sp. MMG012]MBQ4849962.1 dihydroneopterin triphosphate 2'-epimerase [Pseudoalteromonas sp. MMG012]
MQNAIINITNLRLRTFIGFNPEEREKKQDVVLNLEIHYPADIACVSGDEVEHALNYKTVTKAVINLVESGHFLLLEKLVADILSECHRHPSVTYTKVRVDKPHALRFADSVSLTLAWSQ